MRLEWLKKRTQGFGPAMIAAAVLIPFSVYCAFILASVPDANATGGAFTNTKHGGGAVDGRQFSGIDRGVNPDYGLYYNSLNSEAGQYKAGECAQCHEPHGSFGGSEPEPSSGSTADPSGGPNKYLGMADANQEFCWYCHENMNFDPAFGGGTGYWKFYQGKTRYQESGHYQNTTMLNPGYGSGSPWPRTDRTNNLLYGHCLNCHTPHGVRSSSGTYDTWAVPSSKQTTSGNPDVSADYLIPRQLIAWEEGLCENCHKSTSEGGLYYAKDIRTQLAKLDGAYGTYGSGHPVHNVNQKGESSSTTFSGRHTLANESNPTAGNWNAYSNNTRHVECYDCHNPHVAKQGSAGPNLFRKSGENTSGRDVNIGPVQLITPDGYGGANSGVWGVNINTSTGSVTGRLTEAKYLYQMCLKCHSAYADSSFTTQWNYSGPQAPSWQNRSRFDWNNYTSIPNDTMYMTDVAKDFSTNDPSGSTPPKGYHPVFALGRNRPSATANPRWTKTYIQYTSDEGVSVNKPTGIINPAWGFKNNFVPPWGPDAYVTCVDCHEDSSENTARGPHGSDRPFILRKLDSSITYTILDDGKGSPKQVSYSSFDYGYVSNSQYGPYGPVNLGIADPNNFCLNCHRADVYGFFGQNVGGVSCPKGDRYQDNTVFPRYRFLSRQPHPAEGGFHEDGNNASQGVNGHGYAYAPYCEHSSAGHAPRGIVCLRCHGGGSVGGIHGNLGNRNGYDNGYDSPGSSSGTKFRYTVNYIVPSSNRLLNGTAWEGVIFSTTTQMGGCYKGGDTLPFNNNACTHSGGPKEFDNKAMYDY